MTKKCSMNSDVFVMSSGFMNKTQLKAISSLECSHDDYLLQIGFKLLSNLLEDRFGQISLKLNKNFEAAFT